MRNCHKKMTFREFRVLDAGESFRCKECGWTVEIRGWVKGLFYGVGIVVYSFILVFVDEMNRGIGLDKDWRLLTLIPA